MRILTVRQPYAGLIVAGVTVATPQRVWGGIWRPEVWL